MRADVSMALQLARESVQVLFENSGANRDPGRHRRPRCLRDINALSVHALLHGNNSFGIYAGADRR